MGNASIDKTMQVKSLNKRAQTSIRRLVFGPKRSTLRKARKEIAVPNNKHEKADKDCTFRLFLTEQKRYLLLILNKKMQTILEKIRLSPKG